MTRALVALFVSVQLLDLALYATAPHLEANPVMAALPPLAVALAKVAGVIVALLVVVVLDRKSRDLAAFGLAVGIAVGALGVGSAVATLAGAG